MILKKISLNNIRSYKTQEVEFPEGSTLLSGDIGSGKTSVLLGIEFALFGLQPGQRGHSLLRNGETDGSVLMEFEVDGKSVIIERTLKRTKTVNQDFCSITIDGERKEISVSELKNKVLEILNYSSEFAKKQNMLYKFTVYTPQEEMKQIILQDSATRINTLRHVFGIDRYRRIIDNISTLASKLREEKRIKEALTMNLEQDKMNFLYKEEELETKHYNLESVEKELFEKRETKERLQEERDEIFRKIEEKNKLNQELEKTKIVISGKEDSVLGNKRTISQLKEQIEELGERKFNEFEIKNLELELSSLKKEKENIQNKILDLTSQINSLSYKIEENIQLEQKISKLENCPTCFQEVDAVHRANVLNKSHSEVSECRNKIGLLESEKKILLTKILTINLEASVKEKQLNELNLLKIRLENLQEKRLRINELEKMNESFQSDLNLLKEHIANLIESVVALERFDLVFEIKKKELEEAMRREKLAEIKVAELRKEIDVFSKQIEEMEESIKKNEQIRNSLNYINELENWLSKKFLSLISNIEKNVMVKLRSEFSNLFSEWFGMLVSDTFDARIGDDFTPVIEQQDYEIEYAYLSGGERTAVALAYRLALNKVINSFLSRIKTKDIIILDEPTDGFSDQQLDKMRDVFQQLDVKQLIIVSHEQKIEGFVENVIRFKKDGGISRIDN
jgi:exonuclease SbcC